MFNSATITYQKNRKIILPQAVQQLKSTLFIAISNRSVIFIIFVMLLLWFGWLLGQLMTQFLPVSNALNLQNKQGVVQSLEARGSVSYIFGKPDKKVVKKEVKPKIKTDDVKRTRLNLTLVGIIDMGEKSLALIKKSGETLVVFKDDEIMSNVVLTEVYPEEVVINNRGVLERLSLAQGKNKLLTQGGLKSSGVKIKGTRTVSARDNEALSKVGAALKKSPMSIAKFIKFKPVNKNGRWAGVKLWSKSDKQLFRQVGFEEGDLLIDVNGRSISELSKNPGMWQEFLKESQFELIVERNGQEHSVSVDLSGS